MFNFLTNYLRRLRQSDKATIYKHSMILAIILSIIILTTFFGIFGKYIFNLGSFKNFDFGIPPLLMGVAGGRAK